MIESPEPALTKKALGPKFILNPAEGKSRVVVTVEDVWRVRATPRVSPTITDLPSAGFKQVLVWEAFSQAHSREHYLGTEIVLLPKNNYAKRRQEKTFAETSASKQARTGI
jgi:hypothetical protein